MKHSENIHILPEGDKNESMNILYQARTAYEDRRRFLVKRRRSVNFRMGRQWSDKMEDPDTGQIITEEEYIKKDRRLPAQNNQINTIVRNMVGRFRNNYPDPIVYGRNRDKAQAGEVMTSALRRVLDINEAKEIDAREMDEFTMSAAAGWKLTYGWWNEFDRLDVKVDQIDQTRFFFNADSEDVRTKDVWIVGELHDMRMDDVIAAFAKSKKDIKRLRKMFPAAEDWEGQTNVIPAYMRQYKNFYYPDNIDKVRVVEVWKKEFEWMEFVHDRGTAKYFEADHDYFVQQLGFDEDTVDKYSATELVDIYNEQEREIAYEAGVDLNSVMPLEVHERYEAVWRCYYLSPYGDVLMKMDRSPYDHQEHPYIFGLHPLVDGETYSLVESVIDQQKHINRLISLLDASLAKSVKNLMFVPETIVPDQYKGDYQAFADQAVQFNGMIFYKPKPGVEMPKVIQQNSMPLGAQELLSLQMNLMKEISAVNDAVQGADPGRLTTASLYAQRTANAATTNKDYFDFFIGLIRKRNWKIVQLIKQFYQETRYIKVAGSGFNKGISDLYDPDQVRDVDFDVIVGEMEDTLAYRQVVDEYLSNFLEGQLITLEEFLENTSLPFADNLLETLKRRTPEGQQDAQQLGDTEQQAGTGQPAGGIPPEVMQLIEQQGGNYN